MKTKICMKCGQEIDTNNEQWYRTVLYNNGKEYEELCFHRECYKNFHKEKFQEEFKKKMETMSPILNKLGVGV